MHTVIACYSYNICCIDRLLHVFDDIKAYLLLTLCVVSPLLRRLMTAQSRNSFPFCRQHVHEQAVGM